VSAFDEFKDETAAWSRIRTFHPWDLLIYGGIHGLEKEHRCRRVPDELSQVPSIRISRSHPGNPEYIAVDWSGTSREVHFGEFHKVLEGILTPRCRHLLLDITSLEVDVLLLLMPLLAHLRMGNLTVLFLSPTSYGEAGPRLSEWSTPRQPLGYVTLRPVVATEPSSEHWVLLGFDGGRVNRIIDAYDWEGGRIHALLGDPPYFPDGDNRAYRANQDWIEDNPRPHLHRVAAADTFKVRDLLVERFRSVALIDILPFGPKPMILGALLFYFSLPEEERERVRFLYDYPEYQPGHTTGVGRCFCYDLTGFAS